MKKLLTLICSMLAGGSLFAATATFHLNANSAGTSLFTNSVTFSQIVIANTNASTVANIVLFDSNSAATTNVIPAYTAFSYSSQSETNIYTNYFGVATTNTFTSLTNVATAVGASTNLLPAVLSVTAPAATTTTIQINGRGLLGLVATNSASADLTFTYRQ